MHSDVDWLDASDENDANRRSRYCLALDVDIIFIHLHVGPCGGRVINVPSAAK